MFCRATVHVLIAAETIVGRVAEPNKRKLLDIDHIQKSKCSARVLSHCEVGFILINIDDKTEWW